MQPHQQQQASSSPLHHVVLNHHNNNHNNHHNINHSAQQNLNHMLNYTPSSSTTTQSFQQQPQQQHPQSSSSTLGILSSNYQQQQQFSSAPSSSQMNHHYINPSSTCNHMSHDQHVLSQNNNHLLSNQHNNFHQPSPMMSMIMNENAPTSTTHIKNEPFSNTSTSTFVDQNYNYTNHLMVKNEQHQSLLDSLFHNSRQQNHQYQGNNNPNCSNETTNLAYLPFNNIHQNNGINTGGGMNQNHHGGVNTSSYATTANTTSFASMLMHQTPQHQSFVNNDHLHTTMDYSQIASQNNPATMNNMFGMVGLLKSEGMTTSTISNSLFSNNMVGGTSNPSVTDQNLTTNMSCPQNQSLSLRNNAQNNSNSTDSCQPQGLTSQYTTLQTPQPPQMPSSSFAQSSTSKDDDLLNDEDLQEKPKKKSSKKKSSKSTHSPKSSTSSPSASPTAVRKHRKNIAFEDIAACFEMPIRDASQMLGVSLTQLKRLCREFQIPRWPFRRLNSIQRRIEVLQIMQQRSETKNDAKSVQQTQMEIDKLQREIMDLKTNPSPNLMSSLLNDGSVPSSSTEDSGTPSSLNDQFSFPTQDITRYNAFNANNYGIRSIQNATAMSTFNNDAPSVQTNFVNTSSNDHNPNTAISVNNNNNNAFTFQNYDPHTNNFTTVLANNNGMMNNGNTAIANQQGLVNNSSFAQTSPQFNNNQNVRPSSNMNTSNSSSRAAQHTSFHDYSYHFQSKAENSSPRIFFHNITFPVNTNNYSVTNSSRNNNLQGSSQMNSINMNNTGMSSVNVHSTENLNNLHVHSDPAQTSTPHQGQIHEQILNSTPNATLDALSDYEKMQLVALLVQCNNNNNNLSGMTNNQNPNSDFTTMGGNNHNTDSKRELFDMLNTIRKDASTSSCQEANIQQPQLPDNMNTIEHMVDLSHLSQEEVSKIKSSLQDMASNHGPTTSNPSQNK